MGGWVIAGASTARYVVIARQVGLLQGRSVAADRAMAVLVAAYSWRTLRE